MSRFAVLQRMEVGNGAVVSSLDLLDALSVAVLLCEDVMKSKTSIAYSI